MIHGTTPRFASLSTKAKKEILSSIPLQIKRNVSFGTVVKNSRTSRRHLDLNVNSNKHTMRALGVLKPLTPSVETPRISRPVTPTLPSFSQKTILVEYQNKCIIR
ncbi:hypothetical protein RCL_jg1210.t1 [Rhizophagus clarus]|uniref:Uncharacterized protein n=1 Tax=Rhizophagus clarus TaxID=94130 RepID=A0A8H3QQB8_9GLOM|nr:hypothetical protein RCL_jg1210.t1 [Rhizophagus clarus]